MTRTQSLPKALIIQRKNKTNSQYKSEIEQARLILRSLGHKVAIRYLQLRQWTIDAVLWELFRVELKG